MENPGPTQMENQVTGQARKKLGQGIAIGIGCGILTLAFSNACLFAVLLVSAIISVSSGVNNNETLLSGHRTVEIIQEGIHIFALSASIITGITAYRLSSQIRGRLLISILTGFGIGLVLFVISIIVGFVIESQYLSPNLAFATESGFGLLLFFPLILATPIAFIGGLLGAIFVFRKHHATKKNNSS